MFGIKRFNQEFNNSINIMTNEEIILAEIKEFQVSEKREWMVIGEKYYRVDNDIMERRIIKITEVGEEEDKSKSNNKLAHGYAKNQVDEKVGYLLTKDYSLDCEEEFYVEKVKKLLGKYFQYKLSNLGTETSNKGIAWLHPYIDEEGKFKTMMIPSEQCVPLWRDNTHSVLDALIRFYVITVYEGKEKKQVTKVEYHTPEGVTYYVLQDDNLFLDIERHKEEGPIPHYKHGEESKSWGRVPFVGFKNNILELPDIKFNKSLVDDYDRSRSDVSNFIEEVKNLIYVLKGYGGESKKEFMDDMSYYRMISIDDPEYGGVDTLTPNMDITAIKEHFEQLKRDINEFGSAVNKDLDKFGSSPSGIALKFLYAGLDIKCNHLEVEFKQAFEQLIYFIDIYLIESGQGDYRDIEIDIIFNRDIAINETEAIDNIVNSESILSLETLITQHPYVSDVEEELKRVQVEKLEKQKEQARIFGSDRFNNLEGDDDVKD